MKKITLFISMLLIVGVGMAQFSQKKAKSQQKEAIVFTQLTIPVEDMSVPFNFIDCQFSDVFNAYV